VTSNSMPSWSIAGGGIGVARKRVKEQADTARHRLWRGIKYSSNIGIIPDHLDSNKFSTVKLVQVRNTGRS
jgi:hypothetical protein